MENTQEKSSLVRDTPEEVASFAKSFLRQIGKGKLLEAAQRLGVSASAISHVLADARRNYFPEALAKKYADEFGFMPEYLTSGQLPRLNPAVWITEDEERAELEELRSRILMLEEDLAAYKTKAAQVEEYRAEVERLRAENDRLKSGLAAMAIAMGSGQTAPAEQK